MLRITRSSDGSTVRLKLEGSLAGPWVEECRRVIECERVLGGTPELDCTAVRYVDAEGERLVREMAAVGSSARVSNYLAELLRAEGSS